MSVAEAVPAAMAQAEGKQTIKITVCLSLSGVAEGGLLVYKELEKQIAQLNGSVELGQKQCNLGQVGCRGYCSRDVLVDVYVPGQPRVTY